MQFFDLVREVELYLHVQGDVSREMIKRFINESILDFIRIKQWQNTVAAYDLVLDGTGSYNLAVLLPSFEGEIALFNSSGLEYQKFNYQLYIQQQVKTNLYSLLSKVLYVDGDAATLKLLYVSRGTPYPLAADADESMITISYPDIIKQMAVIKMLKYMGDPQVEVESQTLNDKLTILRKSENRANNNGKLKEVNR